MAHRVYSAMNKPVLLGLVDYRYFGVVFVVFAVILQWSMLWAFIAAAAVWAFGVVRFSADPHWFALFLVSARMKKRYVAEKR